MATVDFQQLCTSKDYPSTSSDSGSDSNSEWVQSDIGSDEDTDTAGDDSAESGPQTEPEYPLSLEIIPGTQQPTRGRIRVRKQNEWAKNKRRRLRNKGQEYMSVTKKVVPAKALEDDDCKCRLKCHEKIPFDVRKVVFDGFYALSSFSCQNAYLVGLIKQQDIKKRDHRDRSKRLGAAKTPTGKSKPKNTTRVYYLKQNGFDVKVCKKFFLGTFQISNGRLDRLLRASQAAGGPVDDRRGRHPPANKTPTEKVNFVKSFIQKFPLYESHYTREHNVNRKYFTPGMTLAKLYSLYKEHCIVQGMAPVSDWKFRDIFNKDYSISFHAPMKDTCKTCDLLTVQLEAAIKSGEETKERELKAKRELHHRKAEAAQKAYKMDVAKASNSETTVFCFDLQKTLPVPVLSTGIVYYKRQMWVYNLGVHDAGTKNGYMYVWNESEGSRGPDEIASCLLQHISTQPVCSHVIAYADTCGGQNRNIKIAVFWLHIVSNPNNNIEIVDQKYFISGHSWMDCDKDFGCIEQAKARFSEIYLPDTWIEVIKKSKTKKPFVVNKMTQENLVSLSKLEKAVVNRKTDTDGNKVEWLKIQWIQFRKSSPKKLYYKYVHNEDMEFSCVDLTRIGGAVSQRNIELGQVLLTKLYPKGRKIATPKYKDLLDLLDYIPPVHHTFYRNLQYDNSAEDGGMVEEQDIDDV